MSTQPKITVYIQVYNTKRYLEQCLSSVLLQTYSNFEYLLVDNGCTDGSSEIMDEFVQKDKRIKFIRFEKNQPGLRNKLTREYATGDYYVVLDSDDWLEFDFLEKLLYFSQRHNLDIACTGTCMHDVASGQNSLRNVKKQLLISRADFPDAFPFYHVFFRTTWAKLIRMDLVHKIESEEVPDLQYGGDTQWCFQILRHAKQIGIDNSVLHHYRIHLKSASYQYKKHRFDADVYLYKDAIRFLEAFGSISEQNRDFLQTVYANALIDTFYTIEKSTLSPTEKLNEYRTIVEHPMTIETYLQNTNEYVKKSRQLLLTFSLKSAMILDQQEDENFRKIMQLFLPRCGRSMQLKNLKLLKRERRLYDAFLRDNYHDMFSLIMELIVKKQYSKQYNLGEMIHDLIPKQSPLSMISDTKFFREYSEICILIFQGEQFAALNNMTEKILQEKKQYAYEQFLDLYVTLAALENEVTAFLFGKIKSAEFYLYQKSYGKSKEIVRELDEMGISENEELQKIREELERETIGELK